MPVIYAQHGYCPEMFELQAEHVHWFKVGTRKSF